MFLAGSLPAHWDETHTYEKGPNYGIEKVSAVNHRWILNLDLQKWFLNIVCVCADVYYFGESCYNFHQFQTGPTPCL